MNFPSNAGGCLAPGSDVEKLPPNRDAFDFDLNSHIFSGCARSGQNHDFSMNNAEFRTFHYRDAIAQPSARRHPISIDVNRKFFSPNRYTFGNLLGNVLRFEYPFQIDQAHGRTIAPAGIRFKSGQGNHPGVALFHPAGSVKNNPCTKRFFLGCNFEAGGRCQTGELADAELADAIPSKPGRFRVQQFYVGSDIEVLLKPCQIHPLAVICHNNFLAGNRHVHPCGIGIVGVIDQFPDQFDALFV